MVRVPNKELHSAFLAMLLCKRPKMLGIRRHIKRWVHCRIVSRSKSLFSSSIRHLPRAPSSVRTPLGVRPVSAVALVEVYALPKDLAEPHRLAQSMIAGPLPFAVISLRTKSTSVYPASHNMSARLPSVGKKDSSRTALSG